jgi:hypothetical protein
VRLFFTHVLNQLFLSPPTFVEHHCTGAELDLNGLMFLFWG